MNDTLIAKTVILFVQLSKLSGSELLNLVTGLGVPVFVIAVAVAVLIFVRRKKKARVLLTDRSPPERLESRTSCADVVYDEIDDRKPPVQKTNTSTVSNVYSAMSRDSTEVSYTKMNPDTTYTDGATPAFLNTDIDAIDGAQANADSIGYINVSSSEPTTTVDLTTENVYSCVREELSITQNISRPSQPTSWKRAQSQFINDAFADDVDI